MFQRLTKKLPTLAMTVLPEGELSFKLSKTVLRTFCMKPAISEQGAELFRNR